MHPYIALSHVHFYSLSDSQAPIETIVALVSGNNQWDYCFIGNLHLICLHRLVLASSNEAGSWIGQYLDDSIELDKQSMLSNDINNSSNLQQNKSLETQT